MANIFLISFCSVWNFIHLVLKLRRETQTKSPDYLEYEYNNNTASDFTLKIL